MRIAVLGPLEVLDDDLAPVTVPGAKERLLLAVLAAHAPAVVSTDALAETLWDGDPPASARKSLQAHVVRLRSSLEPDRPHGSTGRYVLRRGRGYSLAVDRSDVDALRVGDLAARGHARLASGRAEEAVVELGTATGLWRGEPYSDWPDAAFAETERRRLAEVRAGAVAGFLDAELRLGRHADVLPEAERLVAEEPLREEWWRLLMTALYRGGRQADALAASRRIRALLAEELGAEPGPALRRTEAAILAQDPELDLVPAPAAAAPDTERAAAPVAPGGCPYKGLAAYQVQDAPLFHGRRRLVARLLGRLVDTPLLLVSGPSGAGKSSVVRAGLVPALAGGALPGSDAWMPVIVSPGRRPVDVLAGLTGETPPSEAVVLVCDQFEELWSPAVEPAERTAFLDALLGLLDDGVVVRCVAVVRGDHVGRLAEHPAFAERLGGAMVLVPALTDLELREIVRGPAAAVGLAVDPELVDAVVADVLGRPGALPLLSTALVGTWERRVGDRLTLGGYLEAGGVGGALTRSAEDAYAALDEAAQDTARRLLVRLADVDEGGVLVRRRVALDEVDLSDDGRRAVVGTFVERRLLAVDEDRLEVVHEALLSGWPRLARWLEDDAAGRAVRRHLAPAAREWETGGRPDDELYRGARLTAALDWADSPAAEVTPLEQAFLDASRMRSEADLVEARERADREAAGRHRTRRLAAGLAAVLVVALVATVLAVRSQRDAQRASLVADANRLAALSRTADSLDLSLLLAAQAVRLAETSDTQDGLLAALVDRGRAVRAVPFGGRILGSTLGNDGDTLILGVGGHGEVWSIGPTSAPRPVFDLIDAWYFSDASPTDDVQVGAGLREDDGSPWIDLLGVDGSITPLLEGDAVGGVPIAGTFLPDGRRVQVLVAAPVDEATTRWRVIEVDIDDPVSRETGIGGSVAVPVGSLFAHVADDSRSAVLWDADGTMPTVLMDLTSGQQIELPAPDAAESLGFQALTSGAAQLLADGTVTLYDSEGAAVQDLDAHQQPVRDIALDVAGKWAVTAGDDAVVVVWDVDPLSGRWSQRQLLEGHRGDVITADVDPSGRTLYTAALDDTVIAWDMTPGGGFGTAYPGLGDRWIANRPEFVAPGGPLVVPTRPVGTPFLNPYNPPEDRESVAATFLDPGSGEVVDEVAVGDTVPGTPLGSSVAVSPDGSMIAVTWGLGASVLDAETHDVIYRTVLPPNGSRAPDGRELAAAPIWSAGWTQDGDRLLLGVGTVEDEEGYLAVVDPHSGEVDRQVELPDTPQAIEPSPDGQLLAVAAEQEREIYLLDAVTLVLEDTVELAADDNLSTLTFSPDGRWLAAGGEFGLLHVIDTNSWQPAFEPAGVHADSVLQIEWLPDSRTVVSSGVDGSVRLFDAERGLARARPLPAATGPGAGSAHLVPDPSDEIVALGGERPGRRYPLEPSVWLDEACAVVGRDLTTVEWERYLPGRPYEKTCSDRG